MLGTWTHGGRMIPLSYGGTPYIIIIISPKNLFNGKSPASFLTYFRFFETTIQCFQKMLNINWLLSCAGIWTHNLLNTSLFLLPLDQGFSPPKKYSASLKVKTHNSEPLRVIGQKIILLNQVWETR